MWQSGEKKNRTFSLIYISSNTRQQYRSLSDIFCRECWSAPNTWALMPAAKWTVLSTDCKVRLDGRGSSNRRKELDFGLYLRRDKANILSSKFHLLPFGLRLLFVKIPFNNLIPSEFKDVEMSSVTAFTSTSETNFTFCLYFLLNLQSTVSFLWILS